MSDFWPLFRQLDSRLNTERVLRELMECDEEFWIRILRQYFDEDQPHVVINARPSIALQIQHSISEKKRVAERREKLGPLGLTECGRLMEEAVAANKVFFFFWKRNYHSSGLSTYFINLNQGHFLRLWYLDFWRKLKSPVSVELRPFVRATRSRCSNHGNINFNKPL